MQYQFKINIFNHEMLMAVAEFVRGTGVECAFPDFGNVIEYPVSAYISIDEHDSVFKLMPCYERVKGNEIELLFLDYDMPLPSALLYKVGEIMAKYLRSDIKVDDMLSGGEILYYGLYNIPLDSVSGEHSNERRIMLTCVDMYDQQ